jgi:hypothetical protein
MTALGRLYSEFNDLGRVLSLDSRVDDAQLEIVLKVLVMAGDLLSQEFAEFETRPTLAQPE